MIINSCNSLLILEEYYNSLSFSSFYKYVSAIIEPLTKYKNAVGFNKIKDEIIFNAV